jgi:uncharacterized Zn finger protein
MPDFEPPRPVENGIKARGARGSIGKRWWSRRFVDVLESFADQGRLSRGRSYARRGQVLDLNVEAGEVTARVQGSEEEPYRVAIGIAATGEESWEIIEEVLGTQAVFRARLLAGEMPPEIEQVFELMGLALFPASADDLHIMCDCPDWSGREAGRGGLVAAAPTLPCKHAAAVLYLLAEAFDEDPFLILAWRGRTRERLLAAMRRLEPAESDPLTIEETPLEERLEDFWAPAAVRPRPACPPTPPGLLLKLLEGPKVKVRRRDLVDVLRPAYEALSKSEVSNERSGPP